MFNLSEMHKLSRTIASQGMVLLKNDFGTLPFKKSQRIGIVGKECTDLIRGGGGSASVKCEYVKSLFDGLLEKSDEGKIVLSNESFEMIKDKENYSIEELNLISETSDTVIVTIKRFGSEGHDRSLGEDFSDHYNDDAYCGESVDNIDDYHKRIGCFYPLKSEIDLLHKIEKSNIENIVLLLNISSTVDVSFIDNFPKIKAVLLTYLPGMEAGTAIADVLCGDVNPSGKLVDTIAYTYDDYPSASSFNKDPENSPYKEDIFVGYRYFETYAPKKVMFPFGFGLSYTSFEFSDYSYKSDDQKITVSVNVKNCGNTAGKEVVQVYSSSPEGKLEKPLVDLRGFAKTKLLQPDEKQNISVTFDVSDMASYDSTGVTGYKSAWVLEKGNYIISVGNSIRNTYTCGIYRVDETFVTKQLTARFEGSQYKDSEKTQFKGDCQTKETISLYDVYEKKADIYEFIKQMTPEELIYLAEGQPATFPTGTGGIGNLRKYGIPNPQTADGPAGIRCSVNATCYPCGTLVACTWDKELQYMLGKAIGTDAISSNVDILLAPSMNIHRNPLGGRNFEYLSEDPLVSGKTAAAYVKGVQQTGVCATIKHFATNNCEYERKKNNSIVSERALREIYLKGFEIAIKESNPAFIMTSYNKLNGKHTSSNIELLRGIVRDEWKYDGAIMTDWRNLAPLVDEIIAGNNIKMPYGIVDNYRLALESYNKGELPIEILRENAYYIIKSIMKTIRFTKKDFGKVHNLINGSVEISPLDVFGYSSTRVAQDIREDNVSYLYQLHFDARKQRTYMYFLINALEGGNYIASAEISTNCPEGQLWYYNGDDNKLGTAYFSDATDENKWYTLDTPIKLQKGENMLKLVFVTEPETEYPFHEGYYVIQDKDIKFAKLTLTKATI